MNNELSMPLKDAWVKASQHKDWEVADLIEKVIRLNQKAIEKELMAKIVKHFTCECYEGGEWVFTRSINQEPFMYCKHCETEYHF